MKQNDVSPRTAAKELKKEMKLFRYDNPDCRTKTFINGKRVRTYAVLLQDGKKEMSPSVKEELLDINQQIVEKHFAQKKEERKKRIKERNKNIHLLADNDETDTK